MRKTAIEFAPRQSGRTFRLLEYAQQNDCILLVHSKREVRRLKKEFPDHGVIILAFSERPTGYPQKKVVIDNLSTFLYHVLRMPVERITADDSVLVPVRYP